jgi:MFS family permease
MKIQTGYGNKTISFWMVFNLYVIYIITSIPGLAISPIMNDLTKIFPGTSDLETQFLLLGPAIAAIPCVFLGGYFGTRVNNMKLLNWTCLFYGIAGALFMVAPNMVTLIILSFIMGIAAGVISPLSTAFISDIFDGANRTRQYGYASAVLNLVLMLSVIAAGYLAKINWRLPFLIYWLPFVPLLFASRFKKCVQPATPSQNATDGAGAKYKFSKEVNVGALARYCTFYFVITVVISSISLYTAFVYTDSSTAGDLTSVLFLGIMASGFTLNRVLKVLRSNVAIAVLFGIAVGFALMLVKNHAVLCGIGIFIASYMYGVAMPYYYDRCSRISSRVALTLTLAWFAVMDSIGDVISPFLIDSIAKIAGHPTAKDPLMAFRICLFIILAATVVVLVRQIITRKHSHPIQPIHQ